jgi:hypothetical protein
MYHNSEYSVNDHTIIVIDVCCALKVIKVEFWKCKSRDFDLAVPGRDYGNKEAVYVFTELHVLPLE